ncbi:hypothetical protein JNUCC0626_48455 [Lentzea sp. JNUCC 0626]|uniref:hypothetical protein n=1 Tax=Lentzea sp. JNUCC 0626 TaxID=3367513 RepID=UPI003747C666
MYSYRPTPRSGFERDRMPLDAARSAFEWLVTGPHPVSVDGCAFAGLPPRRIPLDELRNRLLRRQCTQKLRDEVWAHLVLRARTDGSTWTIGCVGVALPALTTTAATLSAKFANDPSDIHAAVLAGFIAELKTVDVRRPRIMLRLRWAAYRAGHAVVREALDAPVPSGHGFRSAVPPPPWGHPDFVLARAVAAGAITAFEAELIGATRLEGVALADAASERGMSYEATKKARRRAELRLGAYLRDDTVDGSGDEDIANRVADTVAISEAAQQDARVRVSRGRRISGVEGCGRNAPSAHTPSASPSSVADPASGVSRCA